MEKRLNAKYVCMNRVKRNQRELEQAFLERIENISDYIQDFKLGKKSRIKDIAVNLRVLLINSRSNTPLLQHLALIHGVDLIHKYSGPPMIGKRDIYSLDELSNESAYISNVPSPVSLTYEELVKVIADQEGAHEDHGFSEPLHRLKNSGVYILNSKASDLSLLYFAEIVLNSSQPLIQRIRESHINK